MTDREKLLYFLVANGSTTSITDIFRQFLSRYGDDLSLSTVNTLSKQIGELLDYKVTAASNALYVAKEHGGYLRKYLDGSMWGDEELAKKHREPQIENAQAIIDACNNCI
jgi:hypothetical protein